MRRRAVGQALACGGLQSARLKTLLCLLKRSLRTALFVLAFITPLYSQHRETSAQIEEAETEKLAGRKWINFALLAAALGYLIAKKGPAFFNARTEEIQKAIKDATGLKMEADFRSSEIDRRMATLAQEIQKLREAAKADMERESRRIDAETLAALHRIQQHTTQEIESLRHQAALMVRQHAVRLATDLAISRLRDHPEQIDHNGLVHFFAANVLKEPHIA
jgi:F0F1-type ATP synthase membrane subunit b/b'